MYRHIFHKYEDFDDCFGGIEPRYRGHHSHIPVQHAWRICIAEVCSNFHEWQCNAATQTTALVSYMPIVNENNKNEHGKPTTSNCMIICLMFFFF